MITKTKFEINPCSYFLAINGLKKNKNKYKTTNYIISMNIRKSKHRKTKVDRGFVVVSRQMK